MACGGPLCNTWPFFIVVGGVCAFPLIAVVIDACCGAQEVKRKGETWKPWRTTSKAWLFLITRAPCSVIAVSLLTQLTMAGILGYAIATTASGADSVIDMDVTSYVEADSEAKFLEDAVNSAVLSMHEEPKESSRRLSATGSRRHWELYFFYQVKSGGTIFKPEALAEIRDFEKRFLAMDGFADFCLKVNESDFSCRPPASVMDLFYHANGTLADINATLDFMVFEGFTHFAEKKFNSQNKVSEHTMSRYLGGVPHAYASKSFLPAFIKDAHREYLVKVYSDLLLKADDLAYQHIQVSWFESKLLFPTELMDTLAHDCMWSLGSSVFIFLCLALQLRSVILSIVATMCTLCSFATTYYIYHCVLGYEKLNLVNMVSLFLVTGISADDVLIIFQTYQLSAAVRSLGPNPTPRERMGWTYFRAASAMLVTTVTSCTSFFFLCLSTLPVMRQFGMFMGILIALVLVNTLTTFACSLLLSEETTACCFSMCYARDPATKLPCVQVQGRRLSTVSQTETRKASKSSLVSRSSTYSLGSRVSTALAKAQDIMGSARNAADDFSMAMSRRHSNFSIPRETLASLGLLDRNCLGFMERIFQNYIGKCVWHLRWLLFGALLILASVSAYGAAVGLKSGSSCNKIFLEARNIGRLATLLHEVFPSLSKIPTDVGSNFATNINKTFGSVPSEWISSAPKDMFARFDQDGDGVLDFRELRQALRTLGIEESDEQLRSRIKAFDTDGDEKIDYGEFSQTWSIISLVVPSPGASLPPAASTPPSNTPTAVSAAAAANAGATAIAAPTAQPTSGPTLSPTSAATVSPTAEPTLTPTSEPTLTPTSAPTAATSGALGTPAPTFSPATATTMTTTTATTATTTTITTATTATTTTITTVTTTTQTSTSSTSTTARFEFLEPLHSSIEISLVWGISGYDAACSTKPVYQDCFDFTSSAARQWMVDVCKQALQEDDLFVRTEYRCWIEAFEEFSNGSRSREIQEAGNATKSTAAAFNEFLLRAFFEGGQNGQYRDDVGTTGKNLTGTPRYVRGRLKINKLKTGSPGDLEPVYNAWVKWVDEINNKVPSSCLKMMMVSPSWTQLSVELGIRRSTLISVVVSFSMSAVVVSIVLGNLILAFWSTVTAILITMSLFGFVIVVMEAEFCAVQAIALTTFVGLSLDYALHLAHSFHQSEKLNRRDKLEDAFVYSGVAIVGSGITTAGASAFLMPAWIELFMQLGVLILANTALALFYAFFFLGPALTLCGPLNHNFDLHALCNLCSRRRSTVSGSSRLYEVAPLAATPPSTFETMQDVSPHNDRVSVQVGTHEDPAQEDRKQAKCSVEGSNSPVLQDDMWHEKKLAMLADDFSGPIAEAGTHRGPAQEDREEAKSSVGGSNSPVLQDDMWHKKKFAMLADEFSGPIVEAGTHVGPAQEDREEAKSCVGGSSSPAVQDDMWHKKKVAMLADDFSGPIVEGPAQEREGQRGEVFRRRLEQSHGA